MHILGIITLAAWLVGLWAQPGPFRLFNFQAWPAPARGLPGPCRLLVWYVWCDMRGFIVHLKADRSQPSLTDIIRTMKLKSQKL